MKTQTSEVKHTPVPWKCNELVISTDQHEYHDDPHISISDVTICDLRDLADAYQRNAAPGLPSAAMMQGNAAFICRAVNSHDALLEACKSIVAFIESCKSSGLKPKADYSQFDTELYTLRAAIARAEGGAS